MSRSKLARDLQQIETNLLLEGIFQHYGYDFRDYARASLNRRIGAIVRDEKTGTITGLLDRVLHNRECMERFIYSMTVNVTALFRDPEYYQLFRRRVVPVLKTYPSVNIWHAGCSTGEEVYSMAILLEEEGLYDRATLYATDLNEEVLKQARQSIFSLENMKEYTANYIRAGGVKSFSNYYTAGYGNVILDPALGRNIVYAQHNLVTDGPFNTFHVIWCRNVMIYFNKTLQDRVHNLLYDSLVNFGFLGLGSRETLDYTPHEADYETVESGEALFRRTG